MKLKGRFILANGELGRMAYVVGSADAPRMSTIYAQERDATEFTPEQVWSIVINFYSRVRFEIIAVDCLPN